MRNIGMIHRDDGYDVTFDQESIVVGSYRELMRSEGLCGEIVNGSEGSNCH